MAMMMLSLLTRRTTTTTRLIKIQSHHHALHVRRLSSCSEPIVDTDRLQQRLQQLAPTMAKSLDDVGYWTNYNMPEGPPDEDLLTGEEVHAIRQQAESLRAEGRYEQSWSERIIDGRPHRFDKEGVFACEPDGTDYETAPDMLHYMSTMIANIPLLLNNDIHLPGLLLSNQAFNAKLAVTCAGGSTYPLHVDNPTGGEDTRKLTCILYLNNPNHTITDGGELRLLLLNKECVDLTPVGGRLVVFWSDEIPHEVLPTGNGEDRYALTLWLPDLDQTNVHAPNSKWKVLREGAFTEEKWC